MAISEEARHRLFGRLEVVMSALPSARVTSDERRPLDPGDRGAEPPWAAGEEELPASPQLAAAMETVRERFEDRWCDESVPVLGGLYPPPGGPVAIAAPGGRLYNLG